MSRSADAVSTRAARCGATALLLLGLGTGSRAEVSDYFGQRTILGNDDGGVYYVRQVERSDGVGFDGLVWFGQELARRPEFANVFMGSLRRGFGIDANGARVDRWTGRYADVPKGLTCGQGPLTVESLLVPPNPRVSPCDFAVSYLVKVGGSPFGGRAWGIESAIIPCWDEAPPVPPAIGAALSTERSILDDVVALGSAPVAAGSAALGDDLSGSWRGDDGGAYYVRQSPSGEVAWYAESPDAVPETPFAPAAGWANVFFGTRRSGTIQGFWADVPRGATNNAGRLALRIETPWSVFVTAQTGGYGGSRLRRTQTFDLTVRVPELRIEEREERRDDPLLYLVFFKIDGDTVDLDDLASSHATFHIPAEVRSSEVAGTVALPAEGTTFGTVLSTVRSATGAGVAEATRIGVIAYAIEADGGYPRSFLSERFSAWTGGRRHDLDNSLAGGVIPTQEDLRSNAQRILVRYLGPWEGWPWGDPDDLLSGEVAMVTFRDVQDAVASGTGRLERVLTFAGSGARYTAPVVFDVGSQAACN